MALDILLFVTGAVVLLLSVVAGYIRNRLWISEVTLCLALGAAMGPLLSWVAKQQLLGDSRLATLEAVARVTLGISVMGVALRLPPDFLAKRWRDLVVVLFLGLPAMWLTGAGLAWATLGLPVLPALLVGAILAPTDPVVSQSIVDGQVAESHVPGGSRHLLSAESGANDGLGLLFVMLPVLLLRHPAGEALHHWLLDTLLHEVVAAVAIGVATGWIAGHVFRWAKQQDFTEGQPMLTIALALALTVLAGVRLIGSDGILAVFVAGLVFSRSITGVENRQKHFHSAITRFFDLPVFILIGVLLPWGAWWRLGWPLLGFAAALLVLRRLPWWLLLNPLIGAFHRRDEAMFAGWFGPIGVAATYYALHAHDETGMAALWPIVSLVVCASVLIHGITATPLAKTLGARVARDKAAD